jgi:diguanylate cyclase (GGDEF)-like protein
VTITASAGISLYPDHGENEETLLKSADLALYAAKAAGKSAYFIAESTDRSVAALSPTTGETS